MPKRKLADVDLPLSDQTPVKIKGEDNFTADASQDVKKKINSASRTGQACDRCRVRKMRCDDSQEGCAPCLQNQSECKTTDRITGKSTVRGYVQNLERRLQDLEHHNHELRVRVTSLGGDLRQDDSYGDPAATPLLQWQVSQRSGNSQTWEGKDTDTSADGSHFANGHSAPGGSMKDPVRLLPGFRGGLAGNNYLGVSTGNSLLSSIRGTSMNVLGMEIDLADYMSSDLDEPDQARLGAQPMYNKSYRAFVQTAFASSPKLSKVELPPRSEGMNYAKWFFRVTNAYLPIVHKPSFLVTLTRIYDDPSFEPSIADTVMVHTMFAIMYCQFAARAPQNSKHQSELTSSSNFHYHYALGFFTQLVASHMLADVQALTLLCLHLRNFPKPGACWMLASTTFTLAIELGLHRSAKNWAPTNLKRSVLEIEIRKRVFWSLVTIHVITAGNLGRPMALRSDDWDVEVPEAVDDDLLTEDGIDTSRPGKCNFVVGVQVILLMPLYMDLYSSIYAVKRSPHTYMDTVRSLERRLRDYREQWPQELVSESAFDNELGRVQLQYLEIYTCHARLLLRHPSLSLSTSPEFNNENLTICMEVSKKLLFHVKQLQKFKSMDGTWQTGALYMLAIATTLFGHWEQREHINQKDLASLREEMTSWLSIMRDMGNLLGSGKRLEDRVRVTIDNALRGLSEHLNPGLPTAPFSSNNQAVSNQISPQAMSASQPMYNNANANGTYTNHTNGSNGQDHTPYKHASAPNSITHRTSTTYTNPPEYQYPALYANPPSSYDSRPYPQQSPLPATAAAANAYLNNYAPDPNTTYPPYSGYPDSINDTSYHPPGSSSSWRHFTGNMASNLEPRTDYLSSASALMQLGGRSEDPSSNDLRAGVDMQQSTGMNETWPFISFGGA